MNIELRIGMVIDGLMQLSGDRLQKILINSIKVMIIQTSLFNVNLDVNFIFMKFMIKLQNLLRKFYLKWKLMIN